MRTYFRPVLLMAGILILAFRTPPPPVADIPQATRPTMLLGTNRSSLANAAHSMPTEQFDVNGDGDVTPADALLLIDYLNEQP